MKKFSIFGCAAMMLALVFTSCGKKTPVSVVEDGFYVIGDATSVADLTATGASDAKMAVGLLENKKVDGKCVERDGLYEKYVALEGGKTFKVVLKAGSAETTYGAALAEESLLDADGNQTWDQPKVTILKGELVENGTALKVAESGLYHIVIDLDKSEPKIGKPTVAIIPVEWGVRGAMNGWGFTAFPKPAFNKTSMTYTIDEVTVESAGAFKFSYGEGWKYWLISGDVATSDELRVNVNTNLGADVLPGGEDISIGRAVWKIELTWKLKKGTIKNSYSYTLTKISSLGTVNYTDCELELVGTGVDEANTGAVADPSSWNWGYVLSLGQPAVADGNSTWTLANVLLKAEEGFKIRTLNAAESGGVAPFDMGTEQVDLTASPKVTSTSSDIKVGEAGAYRFAVTITEDDTKKIVITKE